MRKLQNTGLFILFLFISCELSGQSDHAGSLWKNPTTNDFSTIRRNVENYYAGKDKGRGSGYNQYKRWEYYMQSRLTADGKITNVSVRNWAAYYQYLDDLKNKGQSAALVTNGYWHSLGIRGYTNGGGWNPGVGRVNVIAFHPTDANTFWVGTPAGGLWKTTNGGNNWMPLTDGMPKIGISGIALDHNNTDVMYVLTGDGDAGNTRSMGVLKTENGGITWLGTGLKWTDSLNVRGHKLVMHPNNSSILMVVASNGVWRTTNSGLNWICVLDGYYYDIEFKPGDPSVVYVAGKTTFFKSTNSGANWTQTTIGVPVNAERIAIGVTPANSSYVYLLTGPAVGNGLFRGVYYSENSGDYFFLHANSPNILGYETDGQDKKDQADYDLAVAVSNTDASTLITGGINCWRSTNKGLAYTILSKWDDYNGGQGIGYTHADIHNLEVNPLNGWLYCCSDGGIFRSTDFGDNWTDLTGGISNTEWYRIAGYEGDPLLIIGGTQDNGVNKWTGDTTMQSILGGDGFACMIDPTNPNVIYYESQNGHLFKSTDGGNTRTDIMSTNAKGQVNTPLVMNHSSTNIIYAGYDTIQKSTDGGASWTNLLTDSPRGTGCMAIGISFPDRLYASQDGNIWRSDNAGANWTNVSAGLPGQSISGIAVNPDNSMEVYVSTSGYVEGHKVYWSTDGGAIWNNISGSLPNIPAITIAFEDNNNTPGAALYLGTDIGVFYKNANMPDWIPFQNGLPTVPVTNFVIHKADGLITAATFGRGLWTSQLYNPCPANYLLTAGNDPSNPNYTGFQYYEANADIESSRSIIGGIGTNVTYKAGSNVVLHPGFQVLDGNLFNATIGSCSSAKTPVIVKPVTGTFEGTMK